MPGSETSETSKTLAPQKISFVIPFFNEEAFLSKTCESIANQDLLPYELILIDNGSTDTSPQIAEKIKAESSFPVTILQEPRKGKVNALESGLKRVRSQYVALGDADIFYPPHYLRMVLDRFREGSETNVVAVMALILEGDEKSSHNQKMLASTVKVSRRFPRKCFTGGAGQSFDTQVLLDAGGFSSSIWPYVQIDHEIMNRVLKLGNSVYHKDLWVRHTDRRQDRKRVRWSLFDRMVYRYHPFFMGDWYFYTYLANRHKKRKMDQLRLREQPWEAQ